MGPSGYYTAGYEPAQSSSKSNKKIKRASRRPEKEERRQTSRSGSRHEHRDKNNKKKSATANSDIKKQRHADASDVKQSVNSRVERRDARPENKQQKRLPQNKVDASTSMEAEGGNEDAFRRVLSVLAESFLQISDENKEKRPEKWAQLAHSRKMLFWLNEQTRVSKAALSTLGLAVGRAATAAEWKALATLISYLVDVAAVYQKYGHPDPKMDEEVGRVVEELNKHLKEASIVTKRENFKPLAGIFLRLHGAVAAGRIGKRAGTAYFLSLIHISEPTRL